MEFKLVVLSSDEVINNNDSAECLAARDMVTTRSGSVVVTSHYYSLIPQREQRHEPFTTKQSPVSSNNHSPSSPNEQVIKRQTQPCLFELETSCHDGSQQKIPPPHMTTASHDCPHEETSHVEHHSLSLDQGQQKQEQKKTPESQSCALVSPKPNNALVGTTTQQKHTSIVSNTTSNPLQDDACLSSSAVTSTPLHTQGQPPKQTQTSQSCALVSPKTNNALVGTTTQQKHTSIVSNTTSNPLQDDDYVSSSAATFTSLHTQPPPSSSLSSNQTNLFPAQLDKRIGGHDPHGSQDLLPSSGSRPSFSVDTTLHSELSSTIGNTSAAAAADIRNSSEGTTSTISSFQQQQQQQQQHPPTEQQIQRVDDLLEQHCPMETSTEKNVENNDNEDDESTQMNTVVVTTNHDSSTSRENPIVIIDDENEIANRSLEKSTTTAEMTTCGGSSQIVVLLVQLGRSMSNRRVQIWTQTLREKWGVTVVDSFSSNVTHVVMDPAISATQAAVALGFNHNDINQTNNPNHTRQLEDALHKNHIRTVTPAWILAQFKHSSFRHQEPTLDQCWTGLAHPSQKRKAAPDTRNKGGGWIQKSRNLHEFAPVTVVKASSVDNPMILRIHQAKKKRIQSQQSSSITGGDSVGVDKNPPLCNRGRNEGISNMLKQLSNLHLECPLGTMDHWRAYHYGLMAGRVKQLDFEIVDERVLPRLQHIQGFGDSIRNKIKEYLQTGTCQKIKELERDPYRKAVQSMIKIWSIGPIKGKELVELGYRTIRDVRKGLSRGELDGLSANAKIGIDCYEDFEERMSRSEVSQIGDIVIRTCRQVLPGAEATIMGSYRRGLPNCGDIDVLILHPDFVETTPKGALGRLIRMLHQSGHMLHDLTSVDGMTAGGNGTELQSESDDSVFHSRSSEIEGQGETSMGLQKYGHYHGSSSYMGVFASPTDAGKRRRIDIKIYPYQERAFASMYFTGNGDFNRSMRLWSSKARGMTLNDHGLFPNGTDFANGKESVDKLKGASLPAATEEDIFELLGLEYRAPSERDSFDAIVEKSTSQPVAIVELDKGEIHHEMKHIWID